MVTTTLQGGAGQSIRVLSLIFEVEASKLVRHAADKCKQVLLVIDHLVRLDVLHLVELGEANVLRDDEHASDIAKEPVTDILVELLSIDVLDHSLGKVSNKLRQGYY